MATEIKITTKVVNELPTERPLVKGEVYKVKQPNGDLLTYTVNSAGEPVFERGIDNEEQGRLDQLTQSEITKLSGLNTQEQLDAKFSQVVSGEKGSIAPTDVAPTVDGIYRAKESGTYTNIGGLIAEAGYTTWFVKSGSVWSIYAKTSGASANGSINSTDTNAPSGQKVYFYTQDQISKSAVDILNLNTSAFNIEKLVPEDRSGITFTNNYATTSYYFEGTNHKGLSKVYIKSQVAGNISLAIIVPNGASYTVVEEKTVAVTSGVNVIAIGNIGFTPANLLLPTFFIGGKPSVSGTLFFQSSTTGALVVYNTSTGGVSNTTQKGCIWVGINQPITDTVLGGYPATKDLLNKTVNLQDTKSPTIVPDDRTGIVMAGVGNASSAYGESGTFYSKQQPLQSLHVFARASGKIDIFYVKIASGASTVLGSVQLDCVNGVNDFPLSVLSAPTEDDTPTYIFVGNEATKSPNVLHFDTAYPVNHNWWILNKSTLALQTFNNKTRFSFWIKVLKSSNALVSEVNRLTDIVDSAMSDDVLKTYDYNNNKPILPSDIFIDAQEDTPLYKNSLFQKFIGTSLCGVKIDSGNRVIDVHDPTYLKYSELATSGRIILDKQKEADTIIDKIVNFRKFDSATKTGTVSILSIGDSLTEGGDGTFTSSPLYLITQALQAKGISVTGVGSLQRTANGITQRYEGHGAWRYRTFIGLESKFSSYNVVIPSPTRNVWTEGVDGTMLEIKANNPFLYEATAQDLIDYPEFCYHFVSGATVNNVSYSQNPNLGTYHIFNPSKYFSERGITIPNIITIALGTNEWYISSYSGWDISLIVKSAEWMIRRFLEAVPNSTKIVVIPCNNMPLTRETEWQEKMSVLTSAVLKIVEDKKPTYSNLFSLSIFAHGSRQLAYNKALSFTQLDTYNSARRVVVDNDVHILNTNDVGRNDYIDSLKNAVLYCMN